MHAKTCFPLYLYDHFSYLISQLTDWVCRSTWQLRSYSEIKAARKQNPCYIVFVSKFLKKTWAKSFCGSQRLIIVRVHHSISLFPASHEGVVRWGNLRQFASPGHAMAYFIPFLRWVHASVLTRCQGKRFSTLLLLRLRIIQPYWVISIPR